MMGTKTRAYTALPEPGKRTSLFTIEDFIYDAEKDIYTCPEARSCTASAAGVRCELPRPPLIRTRVNRDS